MKSSGYNLFIPQADDEFVVYNTLSGAIVILDREAKDCIREGRIEDLDSDNLQKLTGCSIIVEDNVDERRIFEYNYTLHKFRSHMARFLVLPTYDCNLKCPYCYQEGLKTRKSMDTATADNVVKFIQDVVLGQRYKRLILGLYGGDPLLNLGCCTRICDKLRPWTGKKNIEFDVILTTNGTLLSEAVLNRLSPLASVHVTLDGPKHIHNKKRFLKDGGGGTYNKIINVIRMLKEKGINTSIRINIAKDSFSDLTLLLQDLKDKGFLNCRDIRVYTQVVAVPCFTGYSEHDVLCIPGNEMDDTADILWRLGLEWGFDPGFNVGGPCSFLNEWTFSVDPFGDVYKCPLWVGVERYRVGSIRDHGAVTWNPTYYDQMAYDPCLIPRCRDCIYLPKCGGGCPKDGHEQNPASSHECKILNKKKKSVLLEVKHKMEVRKNETV